MSSTDISQIIEHLQRIKFEQELERPNLFQPDPTRNKMGGYSSVPFYCSLCGMNEIGIQDNRISDGYHCRCSVWDSPTGGKWVRWFSQTTAEKLASEAPSYENGHNQALDKVIAYLESLKNEK